MTHFMGLFLIFNDYEFNTYEVAKCNPVVCSDNEEYVCIKWNRINELLYNPVSCARDRS